MPSEMATGDFVSKISIKRGFIAFIIVGIWFTLYYTWIKPYYVKSNGVDTAVVVISVILGAIGIYLAV